MKEDPQDKTAPSGRTPYPDLPALRASKGKTLQNIYHTTRIRHGFLEAIENAQFQALPDPVYSESFIKAYARELEIDSSEILDHYRNYVQSLAKAGSETKLEKEGRRLPRREDHLSFWTNLRKGVVPRSKSYFNILGWSFSIIAAVVAFLFFYADDSSKTDLWRLPTSALTNPLKNASTPAMPAAESIQAAGTEGVESALTKTSVRPSQEAPPAEPAKSPLTLMITAREMTWIRIVEDQKPPYQILLRPGDQIERQAEEVFSLDVGNAGGIDVYFQGKLLSSMGKSGEVVHVVLPKDAAQ